MIRTLKWVKKIWLYNYKVGYQRKRGKMTQNRNRDIKYRKVQQFRQRWLWVLLILTVLTIITSFGYGMLKQLVFGQVWGNRPMSDIALAIVGTIVIFFVVGLAYFFYALKLITEVRDNALYIRFFPIVSAGNTIR